LSFSIFVYRMTAVDLAKMRKYLPYIAIISAVLLSIVTIILAVSLMATGTEGKVSQSDVNIRLAPCHH
jgi:flagellar basal body-associated protein FliL